MRDFIDNVAAKLDQKIDEEKKEIDSGNAKDARRKVRIVWCIIGVIIGYISYPIIDWVSTIL